MLNNNISFKLPVTQTCVLVWYRNGKRFETIIPTPQTMLGLRNSALAHRIGFSEIRAVKADPNGIISDVHSVDLHSLADAMAGV